jgi:hypothetical protein
MIGYILNQIIQDEDDDLEYENEDQITEELEVIILKLNEMK